MIAAVDPGREKFGWVICDDMGALLVSGISPVAGIESWGRALLEGDIETLELAAIEKRGNTGNQKTPEVLLAGSGTGSRPLIDKLTEMGLPVIPVNEKNSTLRGRELFWEIHPPKGLWRLFPTSLLVPGRNIDDLAAWSLVLDYAGSR